MRFLSLFAGIGGFDLGMERAGHECVGQVEIDPFCRRVLAKHWPNVWRWNDVRTLTRELCDEHCGRIDFICGGFPCQDISHMGHKEGITGERSGLWSEYARLIRELRPRFVVVENVAALLNRGLDRVLGDLSILGFDAEWSVVSACAVGAPHTRERLFIVAYPSGSGWTGASPAQARGGQTPDGKAGAHKAEQAGRSASADRGRWWLREPDVARMVDGSAAEVDGRNRACGRAVVPQVAEYIGRLLPIGGAA